MPTCRVRFSNPACRRLHAPSLRADGWEALRDEDDNRVYYFDFNTEESSWERPAGAGPPAPVEDTAAAGEAAAAAESAKASAKGLVLPGRKAARRHSVAKALLMQGTQRAPRMLLPMAALAEEQPVSGAAATAGLPSATTGSSIKSRNASRKASMVAKEDAGAATTVKQWLKVSDSMCPHPPSATAPLARVHRCLCTDGSFWRRRFCVVNPTARAVFVYLSDKTKSKKGCVDLVDSMCVLAAMHLQ